MCLYLTESNAKMPLIADKDILVWKVILTNNESAIQLFTYAPNKSYKTVILLSYGESIHGTQYWVENGFHAYRTRATARKNAKGWTNKIVRFVIPKGAEYYIGCAHEIVSNQIRSGDLKHCR